MVGWSEASSPKHFLGPQADLWLRPHPPPHHPWPLFSPINRPARTEPSEAKKRDGRRAKGQGYRGKGVRKRKSGHLLNNQEDLGKVLMMFHLEWAFKKWYSLKQPASRMSFCLLATQKGKGLSCLGWDLRSQLARPPVPALSFQHSNRWPDPDSHQPPGALGTRTPESSPPEMSHSNNLTRHWSEAAKGVKALGGTIRRSRVNISRCLFSYLSGLIFGDRAIKLGRTRGGTNMKQTSWIIRGGGGNCGNCIEWTESCPRRCTWQQAAGTLEDNQSPGAWMPLTPFESSGCYFARFLCSRGWAGWKRITFLLSPLHLLAGVSSSGQQAKVSLTTGRDLLQKISLLPSYRLPPATLRTQASQCLQVFFIPEKWPRNQR